MALSPDQYKQRFIEKWAAALILQSEYKGSAKPITVLCMTCGSSCDKPAGEALRYGCVHCSRKANVKRGREARIRPDNLTALFITRLREKHGDKYRLIGPYVDAKTAVRLQCSCGREFSARPDDLLYGPRGCNCARWQHKPEKPKKPPAEPKWNEEKFRAKVQAIWGDEFELLSPFINTSDRITVRHKGCGKEHMKYAGDLLKNHGCRYCSRNSMSAGVMYIMRALNDLGMHYEREVKLEGCQLQRQLAFDFGVYKDGMLLFLIEFDGEQHYRMTQRFGGEEKLTKLQQRDAVKDSYCMEHGIPLLRISYQSVQRQGTKAYGLVKDQVETFVNEVFSFL